RRHTRFSRDWSSDVCSSDLALPRDRRRIEAGRGAASAEGLVGGGKRLPLGVGGACGGGHGSRPRRGRGVAGEPRTGGGRRGAAGDRKSVVEGKRGERGGGGS